MREIDRTRKSLEAARGLAGALAASWDAFDVIVAGCQHGERGSRELFAAYAFAGTAAAEGRAIVMAAPSLPASRGWATGPAEFVTANHEQLADALAGLAATLHGRLVSASSQAGDPADQAACANAAVQANLVHKLLAQGEP